MWWGLRLHVGLPPPSLDRKRVRESVPATLEIVYWANTSIDPRGKPEKRGPHRGPVQGMEAEDAVKWAEVELKKGYRG